MRCHARPLKFQKEKAPSGDRGFGLVTVTLRCEPILLVRGCVLVRQMVSTCEGLWWPGTIGRGLYPVHSGLFLRDGARVGLLGDFDLQMVVPSRWRP